MRTREDNFFFNNDTFEGNTITAKYLCHSLSIMSDINPLVEIPM